MPVAPRFLELSASGSILPVKVVASVTATLVAVALSSIPVDANVVIVPPSILLPDTLGCALHILPCLNIL